MEDTPKQTSLESSRDKSGRRRKRKPWRGVESPGRVSLHSASVPDSEAVTPVPRKYGEEPPDTSLVARQRISSQDSLPPPSRSEEKQALPSRSQVGPRTSGPVAAHGSAEGTRRSPARRSPSARRPSPSTMEQRHRDPANFQHPYSAAGGRTETGADGAIQACQHPQENGAAADGGVAGAIYGRHQLPPPESQAVPCATLGRSSFKRSMSPFGSVDRRVTINPAAMRECQEDRAAVFVSPPPGAATGPGLSSVDAPLPAQACRHHFTRGELVIQEPPPVWPQRRTSFDGGRRKSLLVQEAIFQRPIPSDTARKSPLVSPLGALRSGIGRPGDPRYGIRGVSSSPRHGTDEHSQKLRRLKTNAVRLLERRFSSRKAKVAMVVGIPLFLVVIYLVLRAFLSPPYRSLLCSTDDCLDHAGQLLQRLDTSVDPCVHFHAYVCGTKALPHREAVDDLQYAVLVVSSASRAVAPSPSVNGSSLPASKAMAAFSSCLDVSSAQSAEPFVKFMKARGIAWPAREVRADLKLVDVLDILMDLAINWRVVLWFDVKRTYLTEDYGLVVVFGDPGPLPVLRMQQVSTLDDAAYADAVRRVSRFLTNGTTQLSDPGIQTLREDEKAVRTTLLSAPVDEHDVLLPLHQVHRLFTEKVSLNELLGVIGKHLKSVAGVSLETKILIARRQSLARLLSLFEIISPTRLLNVIGWMFSYAYAWMLNAGFESLGIAEAENTSDLLQCFFAVHESFGIVQAWPLFHALFDSDSLRDDVYAVFNSTSKAMTRLLQASQMISNLTKKEAALKIGAQIRVRLLPPEAFMAADVLNILYAKFPGGVGNRTFFDTWVKSREALLATLADPFHDRLLIARYRRMLGSAGYFYSLNLVWLTLSALLPPSYRSRGSALMTYSGLGYQLARQLVRAADERGRKMDSSGLDISWWEQHGKCALDSAQTAEEKKTVSDLFALDVALEALKTSGHDLSSLGIKRLERFSPTQTFYISYCSHFCDDPAGSDECDLAINASDFAEAFGCQREVARSCLFA